MRWTMRVNVLSISRSTAFNTFGNSNSCVSSTVFYIFQRRALARTHIYCSTENIFFSFSWNILSYFLLSPLSTHNEEHGGQSIECCFGGSSHTRASRTFWYVKLMHCDGVCVTHCVVVHVSPLYTLPTDLITYTHHHKISKNRRASIVGDFFFFLSSSLCGTHIDSNTIPFPSQR